MKMKQVLLGFCMVLSVVLLASCGKQVTQNDLMKNKWGVIDTNAEDEQVTALASFSKTDMTLSFDVEENETETSDEMEKLGKQMLSQMTFDISYQLNEGVIHLENKDLDLDGDFNVQKDDNKIIFTSEDSKAKMVLTPYNK